MLPGIHVSSIKSSVRSIISRDEAESYFLHPSAAGTCSTSARPIRTPQARKT